MNAQHAGSSGLRLRQAQVCDIDQMAVVETASWPAELAADRDAIASRFHVYPAGQWVAILDGEIVGVAYAQRVSVERVFGATPTYETVTDHATFGQSHVATGPIYQLVTVGVLPTANGRRIGRQLIDQQLAFARGLTGVDRIVGFTRPVGFYRSEFSIEDYVRQRKPDGKLIDPVLSFHLDSGAMLVSLHPNFRSADTASRGFGVLIEYATSEFGLQS